MTSRGGRPTMSDRNYGGPGKPGEAGQPARGGTGGQGGTGGSSDTGTGGAGGTGGEGGPGGHFLPPLTKDQLPEPVAAFLEEHPVFVRLYVPFVVTVSLIVQILIPTTQGVC